ncbi:hypothetical protein [Fundidesulfovibrio soli]|uniref:hypothetical protein n=1 Tax=Fundidesulfovibrio soli TaxID=2922716 RepID=UPI001FAF76C0|nr:hypothetical protein [Fundidesulfovibrio soli]
MPEPRELEALFAAPALATLPRVLGFIDRDPDSPTFGCCDRAFWHYRLTDLPNSRAQEAGLLLALAWAYPSEDNLFHGRDVLPQWVRGVWSHWLATRNADGSTREIYPFERSFCATSFSSAAFVECARLLGADSFERELREAESTFLWLGSNANPDVANQMAASLHALHGYAALTGDGRIRKLARERGEALRRLTDSSGTFIEYGGLDVGYQTITLSSLISVMALTADEAWLPDAVLKGLAAVEPRIGELGHVDWRGNSRRTQYVYPRALAAHQSPALDRLADGLRAGTLPTPCWLDDRYTTAFAVDYLLAASELRPCS